MLIGYARVSTVEQDLALQKDALTREGCARTFEETASGAKAVAERLKVNRSTLFRHLKAAEGGA